MWTVPWRRATVQHSTGAAAGEGSILGRSSLLLHVATSGVWRRWRERGVPEWCYHGTLRVDLGMDGMSDSVCCGAEAIVEATCGCLSCRGPVF